MPAQTRIKGDRRGRGERMKGFDDFLSPIQFEIPFISSRHLGQRERVKLTCEKSLLSPSFVRGPLTIIDDAAVYSKLSKPGGSCFLMGTPT